MKKNKSEAPVEITATTSEIETEPKTPKRPRVIDGIIKVSLNITESEYDLICKVADNKDVTNTSVIRKGIELIKLVRDCEIQNKKMLIDSDGKMEVVKPWN